MTIKEFITKYKIQIILVLITSVICVFKFVSIKFVPDVFSDEVAIINHLKSMSKSFKDADGHKMPFYSKVGAGYLTYAYMYPMLVFTMFSKKAFMIRVIQNILTIIACILTAFGVKEFTKNRWTFWITLFTALTLPWGFVESSRIWDPALVPFYFSLHFFFYSKLMNKECGKVKTYVYSILAFASLVLLAVVYPPCRIPAVIMWIATALYALQKKKITIIHMIPIVIVCFIIALPLAINLLDPEFNSRSKGLLVFEQEKKTHIVLAIHAWIKNSVNYFSPKFLFVAGDLIDRHSLPIFGVLGTISIIPLVRLIKEKGNMLVYYMIGIIICNNLSCGLTNEYDATSPHALRNCLSWMPYSVLIASGWYLILKNCKPRTRIIWYVVFTVSFIIFFTFYVLYYNGTLNTKTWKIHVY